MADTIPAGLEEFISEPKTQPIVDNQAQKQTDVPHGLDEFIAPEMQQEKYGTPTEQLKAGFEGVAQGVLGPIAPAIERAFGVKPEAIRGRAEASPITHYGTEALGLIAPAIATGGTGLLAKAAAFTQAGALEKIGAKLGLVAGGSLASKIGTTAAKGAIDNMLLQGSDEVSKLILNDPNQSAATAATSVGLAGVLGGGIGGVLGGIGHLWDVKVGDKMGKLIEDMKGADNFHRNNPDPVSAMTDELAKYHANVTSQADEVFGPTGLKMQDITKSIPEMHEGMTEQMQSVYDKVNAKVKDMMAKPNSYPERLTSKLNADLEKYVEDVSKPNIAPGEIFNAIQDLKQQLQGYSKFDKFVKPVDEAYDFVTDAKSLSHDLRGSLEDTKVWGKAAERQQAINKAFTEYLPTLKDFEKKFTTTKADGEVVIDPGKVITYLNQVDSPRATIKKEMLKDFLEASEKYKKVIADSHENLGIDAPNLNSPLNVTMRSLEKKTLGEKLYESFLHKGLIDGGSNTLAASIGGGVAHAANVNSFMGAFIGHNALAPFFKSVLNGVMKPLLSTETNALGAKAAINYGVAVAQGERLLERASTNLFHPEHEVVSEGFLPTFKDKEKLNKTLEKYHLDPAAAANIPDDLNHYLPDHAVAVNQIRGNAITYLNSLRADKGRAAPLDTPAMPSKAQQSAFENALTIAQQPLMVLDKVKKGTVTATDIKHLASLYPQLLPRLQSKITQGMVDALSKGQTVPYKTRIGLSMFLGQPLDSTMTPMAIQSTQIQTPSMQLAAQQQGGQQPERRTAGVKSSPALQKMPSMYQTSDQARIQHRQKP